MEAESLQPMDLPTPSDAEMRIDYGDDLDDAEMGEAQPVTEAQAETLEEAVMDDATEQVESDSVVMDVVEEMSMMDSTLPLVGAPQEQQTETTGSARSKAFTESALVQDQSTTVDSSTEGQHDGTAPDTAATSLPPAPTTIRALSSEDVPTIKVHPPTHSADDSGEEHISNSVEGDVTHEAGAQPEEPTTNGHSVEQEQSTESVEKEDESAAVADDPAEQTVSEQDAPASEDQQQDGARGADAAAEVVESESSEWAQLDDRQQVDDDESFEVIKIEQECPTCSSASKSSRPSLDKSLLALIDLPPFPSPSADDNTSSTTAPTVLLSYQNQTYSVFRRHEPSEESEVAIDSSLPVLFEQADKHELYYDQVERFIEALHGLFPELESGEDEILLELPEIGITLPEDNVYTRQVSLEDLHRVHVGCGLQGSLQLSLTPQPRFSSGFNALAQHIANSFGKDVDFEATEVAQDDDSTTAGSSLQSAFADDQLNEDGSMEEQVEGTSAETTAEGEHEATGQDEHFEDGEWHDEDVVYEEAIEGEGESGGAGETEAEEGDLEEALADMDSEDLNAYIEGVQEDYVFSEEALGHDGEGADGGEEQEQVVADEKLQEGELDRGPTGGGVGDEGIVIEEQQQEPTAEEPSAPTSLDSASSTLPPTSAALEPSKPVVISYDTPLGTGDEPPSVPLNGLEAVVDAAAASDKLAPSPLSQVSAVTNGDETSVDAPEAVDEPSADVVIDYEDAEEVAESVPAPLPSSADPPRSPKRARADAEDGVTELGDETAAAETKRPRLFDPEVEPASST